MPSVFRNDSGQLCVSEHMFDVGRKRRVSVDVLAQLSCSDAEFDRKTEDVDQFLTGMANEVSAQNMFGVLIDDHFRPGNGLGI